MAHCNKTGENEKPTQKSLGIILIAIDIVHFPRFFFLQTFLILLNTNPD